ncbi:beta-glucoside-specific PTS transporter subunit IIABC [Anaerosacchariphilus polymeriproducens]|uniref:PTS beta-glucoside transporter subunit EIIBCA n=1 Tax=Anaerosacchariphilus polymeriproducens TaxID=1812858 RepID=A0A371AWY7_9FIRM|nr:beta-glucoside-specific PTS transporter subunit IIABC [Anaerosacchariphilus polymeriproducens]RDU24104.1 PTS beta-glucoside transporter subunit EIIBCA [Anaerosacchariphilus polymeriproducens]
MNYSKLVSELLKCIGGKENIKQVSHCYTRLRFSLYDDKKVTNEKVRNMEGVLNAMFASGQYQVVIGSKVDEVYEELIKQAGIMEVQQESTMQEKNTFKSKQIPGKVLNVFISCFTPIIPVIAGCGMIKVICALLLNAHILTDTSSTYAILTIFGDTVYYFLPIFVAYTAAKKLETDPFTSMVLAGILLHPNFAALATEGVNTTSFLNIPIQIVSYSAQALPVIITVWLMKYIDKFINKICPNIVKIFLRPMLNILITAPIMLAIIGPMGSVLGNYFSKFVDIMNHWGWIAVGLNAAVFPLLVLTGMHNALIPLIITMFSTQGFDAILITSGLVANIAEGGAASAVAFKTKNKELKGTALSASISALLGITEPALYGVNLRMKRPFAAVMLGSLISGCIAGILGVTAYAFVSPSILSLPIFAGGNGNSLIGAIITVPVTFVITFAITWFLGFKDISSEKEKLIASPVEGKVIPLSEVNDQAFASETLGKGYAIVPTKGEITAPFDGQVDAIFETKHAIGLRREDGMELLIHIGLDTVKLNGQYFESFVENGKKIKKGETLIKFDLDKLIELGYDVTTPVIVANTDKFSKIEVLHKTDVVLSEVILHVE